MNEVWNLDVIYRGFDDPAFAADMEKLEKLVQDYVAFAGELDRQTPLDGLKKGVALEESLSELSGKLVEYAFLRQSGNTRDAEAGSRLGQVMQILTGAAGAQAQWRRAGILCRKIKLFRAGIRRWGWCLNLSACAILCICMITRMSHSEFLKSANRKPLPGRAIYGRRRP